MQINMPKNSWIWVWYLFWNCIWIHQLCSSQQVRSPLSCRVQRGELWLPSSRLKEWSLRLSILWAFLLIQGRFTTSSCYIIQRNGCFWRQTSGIIQHRMTGLFTDFPQEMKILHLSKVTEATSSRHISLICGLNKLQLSSKATMTVLLKCLYWLETSTLLWGATWYCQ